MQLPWALHVPRALRPEQGDAEPPGQLIARVAIITGVARAPGVWMTYTISRTDTPPGQLMYVKLRPLFVHCAPPSSETSTVTLRVVLCWAGETQ